MGVGHESQVVDAGGGGRGAGGLGDGFVDVTADLEGDGDAGGSAFEIDVEAGQVFGVVAQLDAAAHQGRVDGVGVALERDGGGAGDLAGDRPAERLGQSAVVDLAAGSARLEPVDRALAGLGVDAPVGHLFDPRGEPVVELVEVVDAVMAGLGQEGVADVAVGPFLLAPALR